MALRSLTFLASFALAAANLRGSASIPSLSEAVQIRWAQDPSYCLQTEGNAIGSGVNLQLWKCDDTWGSGGQVFYRFQGASDMPNVQLQMYGSTGFCVDAGGYQPVSGAQIQVQQCLYDSSPQDWIQWSPKGGPVFLAPMHFTYMNGLKYCMVIDGNRAFNGAKIQMGGSCSEGHMDQMWQVVKHG